MSPCQQTKWQNPCSVRKFVPGVLSLRNFLRWARPIVLRLALVSSPRSSPTQQQIRQKMKGPRGPKPRNTIFRLLWPKRFSSSHLKGIKAKVLTMANISRSRLPCQFHRCLVLASQHFHCREDLTTYSACQHMSLLISSKGQTIVHLVRINVLPLLWV